MSRLALMTQLLNQINKLLIYQQVAPSERP